MKQDNVSLVNAKFLVLLRKMWWIPVLFAVLLGVVGFAFARDTRFEGQLQVLPVERNSSLAATKIPGDALAAANPFEADVALVNQQSVIAEMTSAVDGGLDAQISLNQKRDVASVVVSAITQQGVEDAYSFYESQFRDARRSSFEKSVDALVASLQEAQTSLQGRIAGIRAELAALPADVPGEVPAALLTDIADRNADLLEAQNQEASLREVVLSDNEIVRFSRGEILSVGAGIVTGVAAAVFGAIVGLLAILLIAWLDRKIRSEADVRRALAGESIDVVGVVGSQHDFDRLANLLTARFSSADGRVLIVPVDGTDRAVTAAAAIAEIGYARSEHFSGRGSPADSVEPFLPGDHAVLVSVTGESNYSALRQAYNDLAVAQVAVDAVVVVESAKA